MLQSAAPGVWTLKFPSHALAVEEIIATYPDSRIVYTHRDPIKPLGSTCSLNAHPLSMTNSEVNLAMVGDQVSGILAASAQRMSPRATAIPTMAFTTFTTAISSATRWRRSALSMRSRGWS